MTYVIRKRSDIRMWLSEAPLVNNSIGAWTAAREDAVKYDTVEEANRVSQVLSPIIIKVIERYSPEEEEVSESDWVIKSNITNEYLIQARIYRELEIWSHTLKYAKRFKTTQEARVYASDYLIGKATPGDESAQSFDMDYIPVPKAKVKKEGKSALLKNTEFENTSQCNYHSVVRCDSTLRYVQKLVTANRTIEWVTDIREAKQYKYPVTAQAVVRKINSTTAVASAHLVNSETNKIVQNETELNLVGDMPKKSNFRVQMCHEVGYVIHVTFEDITELEALDRMFAEARKMPKKPFTGGMIKMQAGTTRRCGYESSNLESHKSM